MAAWACMCKKKNQPASVILTFVAMHEVKFPYKQQTSRITLHQGVRYVHANYIFETRTLCCLLPLTEDVYGCTRVPSWHRSAPCLCL